MKIFTDLKIKNYDLRLTKKQDQYLEKINRKWNSYKKNYINLSNFFSEKYKKNFSLKFNYGIYFSILNEFYDDKIIWNFKFENIDLYFTYFEDSPEIVFSYEKYEDFFTSYEETLRYVSTNKFIDEMFTYIEYFDTQPFKYEFIFDILLNPCILNYNVYKELKTDEIENLFIHDLDEPVILKNIQEEYVNLISKQKNIKNNMHFRIFEEIFEEKMYELFEDDLQYLNLENMAIGKKDGILFIEHNNNFIYLSNDSLKILKIFNYNSDGKRDKEREYILKIFFNKVVKFIT